VHEYYCAQQCHRSESQSVRMTTNKFKSFGKRLSMAVDVERTTQYTDRQQCVNDWLPCKYGIWTVSFITVMHNQQIGSCWREAGQQHDHCPIVRMSVNGASWIFSFQSWVIYVPIGCRHQLMRYWKLSGAKATATCSLPHSAYEH